MFLDEGLIEEIQEIFELSDNWIDDVCNAYEYVLEKGEDECRIEKPMNN